MMGVSAVFGQKDKLDYPLKGEMIREFGADGYEGLCIKGAANGAVAASNAGQIFKRGTHESMGHYLRIRHAGGLDTCYYGLAKSQMDEGMTVKRGETIGQLDETGILEFFVYARGKAENPMDHLVNP